MRKIHKTMGWMKRVGIFALAALVCVGVGMAGTEVIHAQNMTPEAEAAEEVSELEVVEVEETLAATEASSGTWGDLDWNYSSGTLTISYSGSWGSGVYMLAPDSAPNYFDFEDETTRENVAAEYPWHAYRSAITEIIIKDGVKSISDVAFYNMPNLETVTFVDEDSLLDGVGGIGNYAFAKCTSLEEITLPSGFSGAGEGIFYGCTALKTVVGTMPVTAYSFYGCKSLTSADLTSANDIGKYAFANCSGLTTVTFSDNLVQIEEYAFSNCTGLTKVSIPELSYSIGSYAFGGCTGLKEVTIADDEIGSYAFKDCTGITKVNVPASGCVVWAGAFYNCTSLSEITGSIAHVAEYAFYNCKKLADPSWTDRLSTVGDYAYYGCTALTELTIGNSAVIGEYAFAGSTALKKVTFAGDITEIGTSAFMNCGLKEVWMNKTDYISTIFSGDDIFKGNTGCKIYGLLGCTGAREIAAVSGCTFVPTDKLDTPVHSALTNEPSGVHVYWDKVDYALTYNVYRSSSANGTYTLIKSGLNATNYIDVNTTAGKTYYYKVLAVGEKAKSAQSAASKGITHVAVPGFKKIVNVVSGVHVYWNAADGAKTYNVYRSTQKASGYTLIKKGLAATHYIDTTAVSGTTYYYKVVAANGTSTSAESDPFKAITYVGTPDITSRINKGAGIQLGWDKIAGATGYAIYRKPYDTGSWVRIATIEGNKTFSWTDTSVKANNGTVYRYTIRALAGSDMKTLSGCRNTGRTMVRLASRTMNSAVKASATAIKCNWTTTAVCNGYEVRFMVGSSVYKTFTVGNYKTGVKTFTGLKAGQTYKIQVRTYKKVEGVGTFYSAWSPEKYVSL